MCVARVSVFNIVRARLSISSGAREGFAARSGAVIPPLPCNSPPKPD